jgi:hypothetical protein
MAVQTDFSRSFTSPGQEYSSQTDRGPGGYQINRESLPDRKTEEGWNGTTPEPAILLDDEYRSVSRVSKPHAWLKKQAGFWTITDGKSKGVHT